MRIQINLSFEWVSCNMSSHASEKFEKCLGCHFAFFMIFESLTFHQNSVISPASLRAGEFSSSYLPCSTQSGDMTKNEFGVKKSEPWAICVIGSYLTFLICTMSISIACN